MAFSLIEVHEIEPDLCQAVLQHGERQLTVTLRCSHAEALRLPPRFTAELDHTAIVRFEADLPPDDSQSGLFPTDDPAVVLADGRIHHHLEIGSDHVLIDVYSQTGPEYFTVTSEELGGIVPAMDSRLRLWLLGLSVYPTQT
ncbi:MAG: hypothetical protein J0M04_23140 [Verrucomicrobia bacterium]|nr:hypothetical protein [Verrucomicrobiota bacterium]